ncbi:MAG: hypothetical protein IJ593_09250 [Lachnospiraceae bacterium]|nr:hypothetical protein [Lachnospiraceae bacterium]
MKKSTKLKKIMALFLVVLINIEGFAAVVSDNDGSSFITQAEFDSLKNEFFSKINSFEKNIDVKITNAIAMYVANAKQSKKETRTKVTSGDKWTFYSTAEYPTYAEGKPYVHGNSVKGHAANLNDTNTSHTQDWIAVVIPGKTAYKTNGGFKKNFVTNVKKGKSNSFAGERYYAAYDGYYINEGEDITLGGWNGSISTSDWLWTTSTSWSILFNGSWTFANLALPASLYAIYDIHEDSPYGRAGVDLRGQAAARIVGTKTVSNNISIWNDISDSRWYDSDMKNRVGITATTPAIMRIGTGTDFTNWWADVAGTTSMSYIGFRLEYNSGGYWTSHSYGGDGVVAKAISSYGYANTSYSNTGESYLKMANDPNGLQWKFLWTSLTDGAATSIVSSLTDSTIKDTIKARCRGALIYDNNSKPHLSMNAGFPFLIVKKGEKVDWRFSVSDTTHAIVVARYGPFSPTGNPLTECDVEFTNGRTSNKKYFDAYSTGTNSIKFEAKENGMIFLKWITDSTLKKATVSLNEDPIVELN